MPTRIPERILTATQLARRLGLDLSGLCKRIKQGSLVPDFETDSGLKLFRLDSMQRVFETPRKRLPSRPLPSVAERPLEDGFIELPNGHRVARLQTSAPTSTDIR